ncbi:FdrA family protein [Nonomuraea sp. NPDC049655]|uniref:FdrA family protein n=1 Tax=Nonomuraea sp. NPDC049655 TaxID=3364355 RepID=UPI003790EDE1
MSDDLIQLRKGTYHDSVTLMRISRALTEMPGVEVAMVAMATELNLAIVRDLGFEPPPAGPGDLLIALRGADPARAVEELDARLTARAATTAAATATRAATVSGEQPPLTTYSAARTPADLVLVSVPGEHAFCEARDAVEAGLPVMIFSDGVPPAQERWLKELAEERGVLVMGPDCGTASIAGVGLGFANVLRPGPVGLVAASGTGAQQVSCLLDWAEAGISHILGVGGRDLSAEVGGLATMRALRLLDDDPATELIVLVGKPPGPGVAGAVLEVAAGLRTPVVEAVLPETDLTEAAGRALRALGRGVPGWPSWPGALRGEPRSVRGLYAGGTLCAEAAVLAGPGAFTDFGDDAYTRGRAHPMIDPTLRLEALSRVRADEVVLMDVVLGHAADPDPAASLAPAVARTPATVVVALVGSAGDPQDLHRQAAALREAGAAVFVSNAEAARHARSLL